MEVLLISLFIATLLPIVAKGPVAYAMQKQFGRYDNRHPREQQASLEGFGARAKAAHYNSYEALMMFSPGVLALVALDAATAMAQYCAIGFTFCRIMYLLMYWFNKDFLRSTFWLIGYALSLAMIWEAMSHAAI